MLLNLSYQLEHAVNHIFDNVKPSFYHISCFIHNPNNDVKIELPYISRLDIVQSFTSNYMDFVELDTDMDVADYVQILDNITDLRCTVIFTKVDKSGNKLMTELPTIKMYRAVLKEVPDLAKKYHIAELVKTDRNPSNNANMSQRAHVSLQLFQDEAFDAKKIKINASFTDVKMLEVLYFVAASVGIKKVDITKPDNDSVIGNLVIPPVMNIADVIDYLQDRYGIYSRGCDHYIYDGILYIKPSFDPLIKSTKTVHIYNVPQQSYMDMDGYSILVGEDVHLVSNTSVNHIQLTEQNIENIGNGLAIHKSDQVLDKTVSTSSKGSTVSKTNLDTVMLDTNKGIRTNTFNLAHVRTNNPFKEYSKLAAMKGSFLNCGWVKAEPYSFSPYQKIQYHFDDKQTYTIQNGICHEVVYSFRRGNQVDKPFYTCSAAMTLFLEEK